MDRSLGRLWPRAQSKIYEEPKKLVQHGLAEAAKDAVGRRPRTVYSITDKGRDALAAWLSEPDAGGPVLECEQLLKVFYAEHGSTRDLLATLEQTRRWAAEQRAEHATAARDYLTGGGSFPERTAILALTGTFLADFADMVARWADWAGKTVQDWPDNPADAQPDWAAFERVAQTQTTDETRDQSRATAENREDQATAAD